MAHTGLVFCAALLTNISACGIAVRQSTWDRRSETDIHIMHKPGVRMEDSVNHVLGMLRRAPAPALRAA